MEHDLFWIIADAHLSEKDEASASLFKDFTETFSNDGPRKLVVLGDLFSSWIALDRALSVFERDILTILYKLRMEGKELIFITGNRDYFIESLAFQPFIFTGDRYRAQLPSGKTVQFEHGDKINLSDRNYLAWNAFSRTAAVRALVNTLPGPALNKITRRLEDKLSETNISCKIDMPLEYLESYARGLKEERVDILMLGHFHREQRFDFGGIEVRVLPRFSTKGEFCRITKDEEIRIEAMKP